MAVFSCSSLKKLHEGLGLGYRAGTCDILLRHFEDMCIIATNLSTHYLLGISVSFFIFKKQSWYCSFHCRNEEKASGRLNNGNVPGQEHMTGN